MPSLLSCTSFTCYESAIEAIFSLVGFIIMAKGFRVIINDINKTLVKIDREIYSTSTFCLALLTLYFTFISKDFLISSIKCLNLYNESLICQILISMVYEERYYYIILQAFKILKLFIALEWFWCAITHHSSYEYNCVQMDNLILSSTGLILSLISTYMAMKAVEPIYNLIKEKRQLLDQGIDDESGLDQFEELNNRHVQIRFLQFCGLLQFVFSFLHDYIAYQSSSVLPDCFYFYEANSFTGVIFFSILKSLTLMPVSLALYYVFYYKNKHYFQLE